MSVPVFCLLAACVTTTPSGPESGPPAGPDWVVRGTEAATVDGRAVLHGVGSIAGMKSVELARSGANNKAKTEVTGFRLATHSVERLLDT